MLSSRQPPSPKNSVTTSSKYPAFALRYIPGSAAAGCFAGKAGLMLTGQQMLKLMMPTFYYILPRFSRFDGFDRHFGLLGQPEVAVLTGFDTHGRHVVRVAYPQMAAPLQIAPGQVFKNAASRCASAQASFSGTSQPDLSASTSSGIPLCRVDRLQTL